MAEDVYDVDADFVWDDANVRHMARHLGEPRFLSVGRTRAGRFLTVIYTLRNNRTRVVTAYDMTKQPQHLYLESR